MKTHHSFLAGMVGGLALAGHPFLLIGIGIVIGVLAMQARAILHWIRLRLSRA